MDTTPAPFKKGATFGVRGPRDVVRKGWLLKRGNHIKNWRRRFFVLFRDGTLLGFKTDVGDNFDDPLNDFTIKDAQVSIFTWAKCSTLYFLLCEVQKQLSQ